MKALRIGTRGSELALFQARSVAAALHEHAGMSCEIVAIKTSGDRLAEAALSQIGGKRLFVKEIEDALLSNEVDLAVHSSKDMPAVLPEGLRIGAVLPREDARDALVLGEPTKTMVPASIEQLAGQLGEEPRIGTSSVRRIAQLMTLWPRARFLPIRGNLNTRLRKLDAGEFDALVLAAAGLLRLQHAHRISARIPIDICVPAPGQGIIAIEVREDDEAVGQVVGRIGDEASAAALAAERALVVRLGGGCQMPIGAYATVSGAAMSMAAIVVALDGSRAARAEAEGAANDPDGLGARVAERLLDEGAGEILADVQRMQAPVEGIQP